MERWVGSSLVSPAVSRRFVGVEPGNPEAVVPAGLSLVQIDSEAMLPEVVKTQDLARQLIK
jgi:hypothetical protein